MGVPPHATTSTMTHNVTARYGGGGHGGSAQSGNGSTQDISQMDIHAEMSPLMFRISPDVMHLLSGAQRLLQPFALPSPQR